MMDTGTPWALHGRPAYPLEDSMPAKAESPASRTTAADDTDVRSAEGADNLRHDPEPTPAPEPDSLEDIVARVTRLEMHIL